MGKQGKIKIVACTQALMDENLRGKCNWATLDSAKEITIGGSSMPSRNKERAEGPDIRW